MELDTFTPTSPDDIFLNPEDTQAFLDANIYLAGGVFSGGNALAVSKSEKRMLSAGEDGLRIWDLEHNSNLDSAVSEDISCLALSADDKLAISGSRDGSLSIWNIQPADQEDR